MENKDNLFIRMGGVGQIIPTSILPLTYILLKQFLAYLEE
jgi:hypothetical protein